MQQGPEEKKRRMATHARVVRAGAEGDLHSERTGTSRYDTYDSEARDFDAFFGQVLAPYASIRDYAEAHYGARTGELVAIELGGPARKFFAELNQDRLFRRTAGFVLHDSRTQEERDADSQHGHEVVEADVFFKDGAEGLSWRTVTDWTQKNGAPDIIVERMVQGVDQVRNAELYVAIVKRWLSQLSEGGTLLAEISKFMPLEERRKVVASLDSLEVDEMVSNTEMTALLIRCL